MSSVNDFFPSNYLKAADIGKKTVKATIEGWEVAEFDQGKKPVITFVGKDKGVVLNKTNANALAEMFGDDMDTWAGGQVEICTIKTRNKEGKAVDGLCLTPVKAPGKKAKQKEPAEEDDGADVPWGE